MSTLLGSLPPEIAALVRAPSVQAPSPAAPPWGERPLWAADAPAPAARAGEIEAAA